MALVPIREDFFAVPLEPLESARLQGTRCQKCGEVFFGRVPACGNCLGSALEDVVLSRRGTLFTFTTIWHRPPGDYKGPDPFQPYSVGMVELPDGVRIVSPLTGRAPDQYNVGAAMELVVEPLFKDAKGQDVVAYKFRQLSDGE